MSGEINPLEEVIRVKFQNGQTALTWNNAFSLAHHLLVDNRYKDAARLASELLKRKPLDKDAKLLEARCASAAKDYEACHWWVRNAFDEEEKDVVQPVHAAFTFRSIGLLDDARKEIRDILKESPEFPSGWLFYGDILADMGKPIRARSCWRRAMMYDNRNGGVRVAAKDSLRQFKSQSQK